jgi:phage gp36-like protein
MAQYATTTDLAALGLPSAALSGVSTATQTAHLLAQGAKIDSYLRTQYDLPIKTPYPQELVEANAIMAAYTILQNVRGYVPDEFDAGFRARYDDQVTWLRDLAAGRCSLGIDADQTTAQEGRPRVETGGNNVCGDTGDAGEARGW